MYVDAKLIDKRVYVSSYKDGKRQITTHLPPYVFYHEDKTGSCTSIHNDRLKQCRYTKYRKFKDELAIHQRAGEAIYESDVNPVFRLLEERFPENDTPPLKISVIDIEVDKDPTRGWSNVSSPYAIINAITIHNKWEDQYFTLAVAPPTMTTDEAIDLLASESEADNFGVMDDNGGYFVCKSESDLLDMALTILEESDVITGWNSSFFDVPYMVQRVRIARGGERLRDIEKEDGSEKFPFRPSQRSEEDLKRFNVFPCLPEMRMVERFGHEEKTFNIFGRVHLDYLELYRKFTFEELHSYTLDNILKREVNQSKIQYTGSLDQLYRNDFRTFIAYNRQDVAGLSAMDDKLKMIELANTMSHMASVTFDKIFGSVAIIEQAILKELHKQGRVCFDKQKIEPSNPHHKKSDKDSVPGAFVVHPTKGLYEWVASFDINSLYPSVIRSLNLSPECVIGQFLPDRTDVKFDHYIQTGMTPTEAWAQFTGTLEYHSIIDETDDMVTLAIEDTVQQLTATGKEWKKRLRQNGWGLSANGTVLSLEHEGIVPYCLTQWYAQRVEWQGEKKKRADALKDANEEDAPKLKAELQYYDMIQLVMKIFLNSTYGALLNRFCRFYDPRLGKSVTLTGRVITKHMCRFASECMTGEYDFDKRAVIYGDTDSTYATLDWYMGHEKIDKTAKNAIDIADAIGEQINKSFPEFLDTHCLVGTDRGEIIQAGREVVGRRGLFKDVKKRYAIHVIDNEGYTTDKLKIMGMETRRSDTPKFIQKFLEECIDSVVRQNKGYDEVFEMVQDFRKEFRVLPSWKRGTPCRVSSLTTNAKKINNYEQARADGYVDIKKPTAHYSVTAANNTNTLMMQYDEHRWDYIRDGDKIEVLYLLPNQFDLRSVAIKVDENYVPDWFQDLPFDDSRHEGKLVDRKLDNVLGGILDWSFEPIQDYRQDVFETVDFFAD